MGSEDQGGGAGDLRRPQEVGVVRRGPARGAGRRVGFGAVEDISEDDEEASEEEGPTVEAELAEVRKELKGAEAGYDIAEARINKYYELFWAEPRKDRETLNYLTKHADLWEGTESELRVKCDELRAKACELEAAQRAAERDRERERRERERERERRDRYPGEEEERAGPEHQNGTWHVRGCVTSGDDGCHVLALSAHGRS